MEIFARNRSYEILRIPTTKMTPVIRSLLFNPKKPGRDATCLMTSMKSNVSIFIDNAEHLTTLSWIGSLRRDVSIIFAIRRHVMKPDLFVERVTNWLDIPQLNPLDKQSILNAHLGFSAPSVLHSKVRAYLNLLTSHFIMCTRNFS